MGLRDRFNRVIKQHSIYRKILADKKPPSPYLYKSMEKAKREDREQLAIMSRGEKKIWREQHQEGKKLIYEALEKLKEFKQERANEYFSINNLEVVNQEIYETEKQLHGELFNKLRIVFADKPFDREREKAINTFELEIDELSKGWKKVREILAEHAKLKESLDNPEKIAKMPFCRIGLCFTRRELDRLIYLHDKYFRDISLDKYLEPIKEIVSQNEKLKLQVYEKWTQREEYKQDNKVRESLLYTTNKALQNKDNRKTDKAKERSGVQEKGRVPGDR